MRKGILGGLLLFCFYVGILAQPGENPFSQSAPSLGGHTKARLLLSHQSASPGETVIAGVEMIMSPNWHTYWLNAGDAGAATTIDWQLPKGITAGPIEWPTPEKFTTAGLVTYGYHGTIILRVPLSIVAGAINGKTTIQAKVAWLECEELCIPGETKITASLTIGKTSQPSDAATTLEAAKARLPKAGKELVVQAWWEKPAVKETRSLIIEWDIMRDEADFDFFSLPNDKFEVATSVAPLGRDGTKARIRKMVNKFEGNWPTTLSGLMARHPDDAKKIEAHEVTFDIAKKPPTTAASTIATANPLSVSLIVKMLFLAFIGGLILNIMPCVLPVISLKILGFVKQSAEEPTRVRRHGLIYSLGVMISLWTLAGVVIAAKQTTGNGAWGMQMQSPAFLVVMLVVMTLVALNLFGVFEVTLGSGAMTRAGELAGRGGYSGSFFNGMLATALATPCTAPGLAVAAGTAFAQPSGIILLFFTAVGAGLALPYLLLSFKPEWLKFLPKPGAWMEQFKKAMGFPMLAAAAWLLGLTLPHFNSGALRLGLFLVLVSLAAWVYGEFIQRGRQRRVLAGLFSTAFLAAGVSCLFIFQDKLEWKKWSSEAVATARSDGHPVLVDFTADYCLLCKLNKRTSLEIDSVREKLNGIGAIVFKADFTLEDPLIQEELARQKRAGVPLVLVYPRDLDTPPMVLPPTLTPGIVLDALDKAAGQS